MFRGGESSSRSVLLAFNAAVSLRILEIGGFEIGELPERVASFI